jgi:hypothetical protein
MRDRLFLPKPRVKGLAELNAWLEDQCVAHAKATMHPQFKDRTIWAVLQEGRCHQPHGKGPSNQQAPRTFAVELEPERRRHQ